MRAKYTLTRRTFITKAAIGAIAVLGAPAAPGLRHALADSGPGQYVCQYNSVRLRSSYGLSSPVIGVLNVGDVVNVTGESVDADGYTWIQVTVTKTGTDGWTALEFFTPVLGTVIWPEGTTVHVNANNVNLRSGPGLGDAVIGNYSTGTTATVIAGPEENDGYRWHKIEINGTVGWMATDYLSVGPGNGGTSGGLIGATMHVVANGLRLRTEPGLDARIIMTLDNGTTVTISDGPVTADGYTWYEVTFPGSAGVGWVAGEFLARGSGGVEPTGARLRVVDGPLNLRIGGGLGYDIITSLPAGTVVVIKDASFGEADGYTWMWVYLADTPSVSGWIAQGFTAPA